MLPTNLTVQQQVAAGLVLDGAMASELESRGCDLTDALWSAKVLIENPELIYQVHYDYFKAGAQVATTASYQATPQGFARRGLNEADALRLIACSVELASRARADYLAEQVEAGALLVAGSVGPYGAFLANGSEYRGDYSLPQQEMIDFHRARVRTLIDAGADLLACETLPSFAEIKALVYLLEEFPAMPAWFSFTLRDSEHLSDGTPLYEVVTLLESCPQVVALGINCIAMEKVTAALTVLSSLTTIPLVVYPNAGGQYDASTKTWHSAAATCSLPDHLQAWQKAGAKLIGGCCRTTPADIAAIASIAR
ncbi:homocysteine S-methyltransferase [Erwinia endophytica]|uniref:homocysteine S-methyltransferase n=1 Tax=Erwinia endophytica TaxID=1563158 RepID=UPI001265D9B8|nr:homocysteine S-methyltransferase [Erwinia endophytica]KAB8308308.1 homocysteine S-methyltransferase [Erwinia endophytica]